MVQVHFPADDEGEYIEADLTFYDVAKSLDDGNYKHIADGDSVIRERIFSELKDVLRVPYQDIYDKWLDRGRTVTKPLLSNLPTQTQQNENTQKEAYLTARLFILESAINVTREMDIAYLDALTEAFNNESNAIKRRLKGKTAPIENAKEYVMPLIEKYYERFPIEFLESPMYGWFGNDVYNALAENIENEELREYAQKMLTEKNIIESNIEAEQPQPTEQVTPDENAQKEKTVPPEPTLHEFITNTFCIPDEMKKLNNWVAFRTDVDENGKYKKTLLDPNKWRADARYLSYAKSNDNTTWSSFGKAIAFAKRYGCDGIAFALDGSGYTCVDLDHHIVDGKPSELAQKFIDASGNTYIERSVSGNGLHIFYKGNRPTDRQNRNLDLDLEIYDSKRFISMTGNSVNAESKLDTPTPQLQNLVGSYFPKVVEYTSTPTPLGMDDTAVLELIRNSKRGVEFEQMYNGADLENDHSRTDYKFCSMVGWWCGGDTAQVERIFRASGLYRPKKGEQYVKHTVEKACNRLTSHYTPHTKNAKPTYKPKSNGNDGYSL